LREREPRIQRDFFGKETLSDRLLIDLERERAEDSKRLFRQGDSCKFLSIFQLKEICTELIFGFENSIELLLTAIELFLELLISSTVLSERK
jgi:hypothetical protein